MHSITNDIEKSTKKIFRLFFNANVQLKEDTGNNNSPWGVDLLMECGGMRKLSLFMDENMLKSLMKQLTGEDNVHKGSTAYDIIGEIAYLIAVNAIDENYESFKIYNPTPSQRIKERLNLRKFSSKMGEFAIAVD